MINFAKAYDASGKTCPSITPSTGGTDDDDDEDDDAERDQDDELDEDDCEPDLDPDARGDSTLETWAVAAREAGGVSFLGVSLSGESRLTGRLE